MEMALVPGPHRPVGIQLWLQSVMTEWARLGWRSSGFCGSPEGALHPGGGILRGLPGGGDSET